MPRVNPVAQRNVESLDVDSSRDATVSAIWRDEAPDAPRFPCDRRPSHTGERASGLAVVTTSEVRPTKTGGKFLLVSVRNARGALTLRVWENDMAQWQGLGPGTAIHLEAKGQPAYKSSLLEWAPAEVARAGDQRHPVTRETLPPCPAPVYETLESRWGLHRLLHLSDEARALVDLVFETPVRWADGTLEPASTRFRRWPAALHHHHACRAGLFWHSIQVADVAVSMAAAFRSDDVRLDTDALVAGALLHDIGKLDEQAEGAAESYTPAGRMASHLGWGMARITEAVTRAELCGTLLSSRQRDLLGHLLHIVASHHGRVEWGALMPPVSREAWLVHLADQASAKVEAIQEAVRGGSITEPGWVRPLGGWRGETWYVPEPPTLPNSSIYPHDYLASLAEARTSHAVAAADESPKEPGRVARLLTLRLPAAPPPLTSESDDDCPF